MRKPCSKLVCGFFFTICFSIVTVAAPITVEKTAEVSVPGQDSWAGETQSRASHLYPSIWGQAGIFRVRSAYSLPESAFTFGIGGEFYNVGNAPDVGYGNPTAAATIAENLFVGYSPLSGLTFSVVRRNSSTTFNGGGGANRLISSLGDFTFGVSYALEVSPSLTIAPLANFMVASNFNSLSPSGTTLSGGGGLAVTLGMFHALGVPLFLHGNMLYHSPQITSVAGSTLAPEMFFQFSRYHTLTLGLGAEYHVGDFIPFVEYHCFGQLQAPIAFMSSPSRISFGTRFTPLSNKSLSILAGVDVGLASNGVAGMPYTPPVQAIAQLSYTTGLTSSERTHYVTNADVQVVNRKFVIKKNINFKVGSAVLEPSSAYILDQIADVILKNNVNKLLIVGHTDSSAADEYNLRLSSDRAVTVKNYLVGKGVAEDALMTQGYGKRKPRASNATEAGRAKNRRVEFLIVE